MSLHSLSYFIQSAAKRPKLSPGVKVTGVKFEAAINKLNVRAWIHSSCFFFLRGQNRHVGRWKLNETFVRTCLLMSVWIVHKLAGFYSLSRRFVWKEPFYYHIHCTRATFPTTYWNCYSANERINLLQLICQATKQIFFFIKTYH